MSNHPVIAIDGPSASGKGTIAARVAQALGWAYLDSGALYRLTALSALKNNVDLSDENAIAQCAKNLQTAFVDNKIFLDNQDVTNEIRQEAVGNCASKIAAFPQMRAALLDYQRHFAQNSPLVADGRDMGSVVFPDAVVKIFLTASSGVRAWRRAKQLGVLDNAKAFAQILADIEARDQNDIRRKVAPLVCLDDAHFVDTSMMTIDEAVQKVLSFYSIE